MCGKIIFTTIAPRQLLAGFLFPATILYAASGLVSSECRFFLFLPAAHETFAVRIGGAVCRKSSSIST